MKEISVKELKSWRDDQRDYQLIDVREDIEYEVSNIGGTHIPLGRIMQEIDKLDRDKPVIIQCRSGKRSAQAISLLEQREGFENLYNLKGGILAWKDEIDPNLTVY